LTKVPPFPAVAIKALQVISNEHGQLRELSELITADPAFSVQILRMANSALYGGRVEISSILQAILILGLECIKGVVTTIALKTYLGDSIEVPALRACWRHSLASAVLAEELARVSLIEPDVAYTAGLIHDVGRLGMVAAYPKEYTAFLTSIETELGDILQRERELFGIDHCEAGRQLVIRWKLPTMFIAVTSRHHDTKVAGEPAALWTVRYSCMIADALGFDVIHGLPPRSYEEILGTLPERDRSRFPQDPSELTNFIANKINLIECT
jgi:HD-like signal output (HDOD) protein